MAEFDASKRWIVITPRGTENPATAGTEVIADLARCLGSLCARTGLSGTLERMDGTAAAPSEGSPLIVLNSDDRAGNVDYAWRAGLERIEIYGGSRKGLANGIYDFLDAVGFRWPAPGSETLPGEPSSPSASYPLARSSARVSVGRASGVEDPPASDAGDSVVPRRGYRRLVLDSAMGGKDGEAWVQWAARNRLDAIVIPFDSDESTIDAWSDRVLHRRQRVVAAARRYGLSVEEGGRCLSRLVPRRLFLRNRELFRMREGRRTADYNFCPTNPETIAMLGEQAKRRFRDRSDVEVFHLWPDAAADGGWCSCPTCRAFTPSEQALIAVNAVADALAEIRSGARLSYIPGESDSGAIKPRKNLIPVDEPRRSGDAPLGPALDEWIFADRP
jgi:hypothetical protein